MRAFLTEGLPFTAIPTVIERTIDAVEFISKPRLDEYVQADQEARKIAKWFVDKLKS